jgi:hypothetical protein
VSGSAQTCFAARNKGWQEHRIVLGVDGCTYGKEVDDETDRAVTRRNVESSLAILRWRSGGAAAMGTGGGSDMRAESSVEGNMCTIRETPSFAFQFVTV